MVRDTRGSCRGEKNDHSVLGRKNEVSEGGKTHSNTQVFLKKIITYTTIYHETNRRETKGEGGQKKTPLTIHQ